MFPITQIWHGSSRDSATLWGADLQDVKKRPTFPLAQKVKRCRETELPKSAAFTLVEILIATVLMAALLVALWRLVGIYTSLRDKGEMHAGRVGNVSVILQQFEEDLHDLPDVRTKDEQEQELSKAHEFEAETENREAREFEAAYDDDPPVETLSESAITLDRMTREESLGNQPAPSIHTSADSFSTDDAPLENPKPVREHATYYSTRSDSDAQGCLIGDQQSLTLANLECQHSQLGSEVSSQDPYELLDESGNLNEVSKNESSSPPLELAAAQFGEGQGLQGNMPTRYVRYWLAGVMPLMAQATSGEVSVVGEMETSALSGVNQEGEAIGDQSEMETDERAAGLYREEVVGVSAPVQMRSLRSRKPIGSLEFDNMEDYSQELEISRMDTRSEAEDSEATLRRSFHLAQVEWAKFRYFDGNRWKSAWDSRIQGELPVAIEMSLWLIRRNAKQAAGASVPEESSTLALEGNWSKLDGTSEDDTHTMLAGQTLPVEPLDTESSAVDQEDRMERQPEVRQLVVLRTAVSGEEVREEDFDSSTSRTRTVPRTTFSSPRRASSTRVSP